MIMYVLRPTRACDRVLCNRSRKESSIVHNPIPLRSISATDKPISRCSTFHGPRPIESRQDIDRLQGPPPSPSRMPPEPPVGMARCPSLLWPTLLLPLLLLLLLLLLLPVASLPPPPPGEPRTTCGGEYGWWAPGRACPPPQWAPVWALNLSTVPHTPWGDDISLAKPGLYDPINASQWGMVNFDWADGASIWQNVHPHNDEATLVEQCRRVKALGTGTKCFVYRNNELALQWQETSRAAMTQKNVDAGWFLRFKTKEGCDAAPPCNIAVFHDGTAAHTKPPVPCNKTAPVTQPNCP